MSNTRTRESNAPAVGKLTKGGSSRKATGLLGNVKGLTALPLRTLRRRKSVGSADAFESKSGKAARRARKAALNLKNDLRAKARGIGKTVCDGLHAYLVSYAPPLKAC